MAKGFPGKLKKSSKVRNSSIFDKNLQKPLTEGLIEKLVKEGWNRDSLLRYKKEGYKYNPYRNSICSPVRDSEGNVFY